MSEMSFEDMLNESFKTIRTGEVVTGKVIDVKPDVIVLNIGYKSDGVITRADYSADSSLDLTTVVKVGDEVEAKVRKVNDGEGLVALSHRDVIAEKSQQRVRDAFENEEVVTGTVEKAVNGGLSVDFEGCRVFIPASLVSDMYERDLTKYAGQEIQFVITEYNPQKRATFPLLRAEGCKSNNGTKATPCLAADMAGDWREEVLLRTETNDTLRLYVTPHSTPYRFVTFLQDPVYRLSVATQNVGYNQPSEPGFYFGPDAAPQQ